MEYGPLRRVYATVLIPWASIRRFTQRLGLITAVRMVLEAALLLLCTLITVWRTAMRMIDRHSARLPSTNTVTSRAGLLISRKETTTWKPWKLRVPRTTKPPPSRLMVKGAVLLSIKMLTSTAGLPSSVKETIPTANSLKKPVMIGSLRSESSQVKIAHPISLQLVEIAPIMPEEMEPRMEVTVPLMVATPPLEVTAPTITPEETVPPMEVTALLEVTAPTTILEVTAPPMVVTTLTALEATPYPSVSKPPIRSQEVNTQMETAKETAIAKGQDGAETKMSANHLKVMLPPTRRSPRNLQLPSQPTVVHSRVSVSTTPSTKLLEENCTTLVSTTARLTANVMVLDTASFLTTRNRDIPMDFVSIRMMWPVCPCHQVSMEVKR